MLTIAIPTYNRAEILRNNLLLLLPQLTKECSLLIIDNNSNKSVEIEISELLIKYSHINIKVIRNKYNVGLTGNIIKCFEYCESEWLWILGDDDKVTNNSILQILNDIEKNKEKTFLSYAWDEPSLNRDGVIVTHGVDELIEKMESLGVILFISTSVYNTKNISNYLSFGSFFQTSYAPHLAILFMSLKNDGKCLLSNKQIVINDSENTPQDLKWDQIFIYQLILLLRLPLSSQTIYKLKLRLQELTRLWTITHFIFTLTFLERMDDKMRPLTLYKDIVNSFYYMDSRISTKLLIFIGHFVIQNPFLFRLIFQKSYKIIKGKEFNPVGNLRI